MRAAYGRQSSPASLRLNSSRPAHRTISPSIVPALGVVLVIGVEGCRRHPVLKSRGALISRSVVFCRVETLRLTHAVAVFEMSRWLAVQGARISTRGAWRPVVVVCLIHICVLLSHAGGPGGSGGPKEAASSRGPSRVCKEPAVARCESLKWLAPNLTKLVQLERTASAVVRSCAEDAAACLQLRAAGERSNECGGSRRGRGK
jgi:hypothetical protein